MKKRKIIVWIVLIVLVLALLFKNTLIRGYVSVFNESLENYASQLLQSNKISDNYGVWETKVYPTEGMVEFWTGGFGLAPSSKYTGFYYSEDNTHKLFSAAHEDSVSMEIDGDKATWTDGTDNRGSSVRIVENWFWFEASF